MKEQIKDIQIIREMMEKSTKFLSLSGLSGIFAGVTALLGAGFAYFYLLKDPSLTNYNRNQELLILLADAIIVLVASISMAVYLSWKKAKKNNQKFFNNVARRVLYNLSIPLVSGGIFCLIFLYYGDIRMVIAGTLLFYGLALINTSKYTFEEIHYLGLTEIVLGIVAAVFASNGILFWVLGFGICHIIYGVILYRKYDIQKK
jgi:hypothetical protein